MNNIIDYIELNKLSQLHNNDTIFFCKTDYLLQDFEYISKLNHDVVLISGNSDYAITDTLLDLAPKNIKIWFAQNAVANNPKLQPIPMGLENKLPATRFGHGVGYLDRASEKEKILRSLQDNTAQPSKFIYANFNIYTNLLYRQRIKDIAQEIEYIDWHEPTASLSSLFAQFLEYKMILCPIGNGIDTHRLWEVLYANRVPITIKLGPYKIYSLYEQLPIIILDNIDQLNDYSLIYSEYFKCQEKKYNRLLLDTNYWIELIRSQTITNE